MRGELSMDPVHQAKTILPKLKTNPFLTDYDKTTIKNFEDLSAITKKDAYSILNLQHKLNRKQFKLNRELKKLSK